MAVRTFLLAHFKSGPSVTEPVASESIAEDTNTFVTQMCISLLEHLHGELVAFEGQIRRRYHIRDHDAHLASTVSPWQARCVWSTTDVYTSTQSTQA